MTSFYCRLKSLKVKDLEKVDTRIIFASHPDWQQIANEFRRNLRDRVESELLTIVHDYPIVGGYKLVDVPIVSQTNLLLFSNDASKRKNYVSYHIEFFNQRGNKIGSKTVETLHERNMFVVFPPEGASSFDYSIDNESWIEHHYKLGFECLRCVPASDSE